MIWGLKNIDIMDVMLLKFLKLRIEVETFNMWGCDMLFRGMHKYYSINDRENWMTMIIYDICITLKYCPIYLHAIQEVALALVIGVVVVVICQNQVFYFYSHFKIHLGIRVNK